MSGNDNGRSATDIITYIGVPLAVLGVLPILYNTVATLVHASKIKRMLRHARLTALTRSDVVNRVIEIELPRYAVTPLDRFQERHDYWSLSRHPSSLPGGSWTTFHWKTNTIGVKTQRVEYADQLRQPQADVAFDELIAYLLDLGAVPDPHGWRLLRTTGLWTPVGCALMRAPVAVARPSMGMGTGISTGLSGAENESGSGVASNVALALAPLDDADGNLSLVVTWKPEWTQRSYADLPPYWVNLPAPSRPDAKTEEGKEGLEGSRPTSKDAAESAQTENEANNAGETKESGGPDRPATAESQHMEPSAPSPSVAAAAASAAVAARPISCQISADGIVMALAQTPQQHQRRPTGFPVAAAAGGAVAGSTVYLDGLPIGHLRTPRQGQGPSSYASQARAGVAQGVWFASAVTAFGTTSQTMLWNYQIPDDVLGFARRETVPCGALVLLGMVADSATPAWATQTGERDRQLELQRFQMRTQEIRAAEQAERLMPPAQRAQAVRIRQQRQSMQQLQDMTTRHCEQQQQRDTRELEALHSPKWDARLVAEHVLRWLQRQGHVPADPEGGCDPDGDGAAFAGDVAAKAAAAPVSVHLRRQAGHVLHRMVREPAYAAQLCATLDRWKAWADRGGMQRDDLAALAKEPVRFAEAALLMALIRDTTTAVEGTLAADLQGCLHMWRNVRLG